MKKQLMIVGITVILLIVGFSGCNENTSKTDEKKIIGTWTYSIKYNNDTMNLSYVFVSNKTFEIITSYIDEVDTSNGTWNITDNKLLITIEGETITSDYKFSNNNTKLTITYSSEYAMVFTKQ